MPDRLSYEELGKKLEIIEEKERIYRALVENSPDLLYRTDLQGRITYISRSVHELSGYTNEEAIGMKMAEEVYLVPEERNLFLARLQQEGSVKNFEARLKRKDGSVWWASTNAHFYRNKDGEIAGIEGTTRDISEIKATEQALRESEAKFRAIFEQAAVGVALILTRTGELLQTNRKYGEILGYTTEELVGMTFQEITHPDDLPADEEKLRLLLAGKIRDVSIEKRYIRKNGSIVWANLNVAPMWASGEEPTHHIAVIVDITDRKRIEAEVSTLSGLLPICSSCKKIRDDSGYWNQIESYIEQHTDADFSHGLCPSCMREMYGDQKWFRKKQQK